MFRENAEILGDEKQQKFLEDFDQLDINKLVEFCKRWGCCIHIGGETPSASGYRVIFE